MILSKTARAIRLSKRELASWNSANRITRYQLQMYCEQLAHMMMTLDLDAPEISIMSGPIVVGIVSRPTLQAAEVLS